ncbi:MAG: hypothetical protein N4A71_13695 [Carboxylicivirga sp.]|jgi:hypothetical protein|nr:hypothetical protein [Carboxylicivirga sp.]
MALTHEDKLRIWYKIEKMCFSPERPQAWLNLFCGWLRNSFDQIQHVHPTSERELQPDEIDFGVLKLTAKVGADYSIKIIVPIESSIFPGQDGNIEQATEDVPYTFDYDSRYASLLDYTLEPMGLEDISEGNIIQVLNELIVHPVPHCHIEPINHEFRIGSGIKNPLVFIYSLAFQLLEPDKRCRYADTMEINNKKDQELNRLASIINRNKGALEIKPGVLFRLP